MYQRKGVNCQVVKNGKKVRIVAASASRLHGKKFKARETPDGWIIGERRHAK